MLNQESEANQAELIEDLHERLDDVVAGRVQPWNRKVNLAVIVSEFESIRNQIHTRNEWWSNVRRLDDLEVEINNIPDAKSALEKLRDKSQKTDHF